MEIESIYENIQGKNRKVVGPQTQSQSQTECQNWKRWFVLITVCLGLICVLLVIALILLYINLTANRDQMKMKYVNTVEEYNKTLNSLKVKYSHLNDERDQIEKNLTSMSQKKLELETRIKNLNDALNAFPGTGSVWYYISSQEKSWSDSRQFCRDCGADLVVINNEEEQRYLSSLVNERVWIGLSDIEQEGNMKWVDNTTLKKGFWYEGEPNDDMGKEDCVELWTPKPFMNNWNDVPCSVMKKWICEKWG